MFTSNICQYLRWLVCLELFAERLRVFPEVGEINNAREEYNFKFGKVFDQNAKQEDVFEKVAVEAVTCDFALFFCSLLRHLLLTVCSLCAATRSMASTRRCLRTARPAPARRSRSRAAPSATPTAASFRARSPSSS